MTVLTAPTPHAATLESFLCGAWRSGSDRGAALSDPTTGATLAYASSAGLDLAAAVAYARNIGRASLGALTFAQRAAVLGRIADALAARRDDWYALARSNSGNTAADAAIDVDGGIGTLKFFAKAGAQLGDARLLSDGGDIRLARDPNVVARHLGVRIGGIAVHINAYNFPSWGLWEKAAVSLLAGVPAIVKPATATAMLAGAMVRAAIDAGALPDGALSLLCGSAGDLLDHLQTGDAIAFTGSAATGETIRRHPAVLERGVRLNIEADSLNSALLGPDDAPGTPAFDLLVREVVREMTVKAGQKCTAIRRVLVPAAHAGAAADAIAAALDAVRVGDPAQDGTTMGPVVSVAQRRAVEAGISALAAEARVVTASRTDSAETAGGAFVAPTLLLVEHGSGRAVHEVEVFGPVATVIPYAGAEDAFGLAALGGGSLVASVFSADPAFLAAAVSALGPTHGRILLVDPSIGESQPGHGIVLPSCTHGGPGRAGGGEELGGLRGLWLYHQRVAVQGAKATLALLAPESADPAAS